MVYCNHNMLSNSEHIIIRRTTTLSLVVITLHLEAQLPITLILLTSRFLVLITSAFTFPCCLFKHLKPGMCSQAYRDQCAVPDLSLTVMPCLHCRICMALPVIKAACLSTLAAALSSCTCCYAPSHSFNTAASCAARRACCHVWQQQLQQAAACLWIAQVSFCGFQTALHCASHLPPGGSDCLGLHSA